MWRGKTGICMVLGMAIGPIALAQSADWTPTKDGNVWKLTARDDYAKTRRDLVVHPGEEILIRLRIPTGTRYKLERDELKGVLKLEEDADGEILRDMPWAQDPSDGPRVGGDRVFMAKFRAVKAGRADIDLRFTDLSRKTHTYRVRVKVEGTSRR